MDDSLERAVVQALYRFFLMRDADPGGLEAFAKQVSKSSYPADAVFALLENFANSEEAVLKRSSFMAQRLGQIGSNYNWAGGLSPGNVDFFGEHLVKPGAATDILVTGMPRSGTSAVVSLLNFHPGIVVTNERFVFPDLGALLPSSLTRQSIADYLAAVGPRVDEGDDPIAKRLFPSFFDIGHTFLNVDPSVRQYVAGRALGIRESRLDWTVGGDKVTNPAMWALPLRMAANPGLRVVFVLRNPLEVLRSGRRKAELDANFAVGFSTANFQADMLAEIELLHWIRRWCPERALVIDYRGFFESVDRMMRFLEVVSATFSLEGEVHASGVDVLLTDARTTSSSGPAQAADESELRRWAGAVPGRYHDFMAATQCY